jgi:RNA polymerase sigma factor (sigma-70 family)
MPPPTPPARTTASPAPPRDPWITRPDGALIEACRDGEAGAWEELIARYKALVYSVPRRYGFDADASDEVFQEVFAILLRQLDGIRNPTGFPKWLITTAHRTCHHVRRKQGPIMSPQDRPDAESPPEEQVLAWEREQVVRDALRRLDGRCRDLLTSLHGGSGGSSYEDVARRLGIPVGSIGPTRSRCLERLMGILETVDRGGVL